MRASVAGEIQTVRALLRRGVAVNQKNAIGVTPLMLAARAGAHGGYQLIQALLPQSQAA
jgi:ankyrin repeat protein